MARKRTTAEAEATPRDVLAKWAAEGTPLALQVKRAASSLAWYRRALRRDDLKPASRRRYRAQERLYVALVAALRAERDKKGEAAT